MTKGGRYATGAILALAGTGVLTVPAVADVTQPEPWQMGLQPAATPIMEMIHRFNDGLLVVVTLIVLLVLVAIAVQMFLSGAERYVGQLPRPA